MRIDWRAVIVGSLTRVALVALLVLSTAVHAAGTAAGTAPTVRLVVVQDGLVQLEWDPNPASDQVVEYFVGYRTDTDPEVVTSTGLTLGYKFTTLTRGKKYYFRAYAENVGPAGRQRSPPSHEVSTTIPGTAPDTTPPSVPTNLQGTAASMFAINLAWQASTDDSAVTGYTVYRDGVRVGDATTTSFSDTGLQSATTYSYAVRAFDAAGNVSGISPAINVSTLGDTVAPSSPAGLTAVSAQTSINLTWQASTDNIAVTGYRVSRNGAVLGLTNATTYLDAPLTPGTPYNYAVSAVDAANNVSTPATLTVSTTSSVPQPCTNNGTPYSITITVKSYTKNVGLGARGEVFLTVANGFAITQLQVKLGTQVVSEVIGTELRDVIGLGWTAPRAAGSFNLFVTARDVLGCSTTTTLARQVVVR